MAYRRSLTTGARIFAQQRFASSFSYLHHSHSDEKAKSYGLGFGGGRVSPMSAIGATSAQQGFASSFSYLHHSKAKSYGTCLGFGGGYRRVSLNMPMTASARNMSTGASENMIHVANKTMEVASSEVALAAADSWLPVATMQYAIDGIHSFTGLNWWASLVISTLVLRALILPITIKIMKDAAKTHVVRQELEENTARLGDVDDTIIARAFKKHDFSLFHALMWPLIQLPIYGSYYLAVWNMTKLVSSFETGGASWFLDLTTADPSYVLPCLSAFSIWMHVEVNGAKELEDAKTKVLRGCCYVCMVPVAAMLPKAVLCCWITNNLFLLVAQPSLKKLFNIRIIPAHAAPPPAYAAELRPTSEEQHKQP